jgi:hypothetical protein
MTSHLLPYCQADNLIEPASALAALELTLDVHHRLTHRAG